MKVTAIITSLLTINMVACQIPNVYEFCAALLKNPALDNPVTSCQQRCPQGLPGKRGGVGERGLPGPKGDRGEEGTCNSMEKKITNLQGIIANMLSHSPDTLVSYCGLGMKSGLIPNNAITASSRWDGNYAGHKARLDHGGSTSHAWHARPSNIGQWIQVEFLVPTIIYGVITQGRPLTNEWIKSYKFACANGTNGWIFASENESVKIFEANTDSNSKSVNILPTLMTCSSVRVYPQSWKTAITMRMELLGEKCIAIYKTLE